MSENRITQGRKSRRMSKRRKSREEIRREIREFMTQQHRRSGSARGLGRGAGVQHAPDRMDYKGEMKPMRGMGGFAKALLNKTSRNKTPLEELIAEELGYRIRVRTKIRQYVESVVQ